MSIFGRMFRRGGPRDPDDPGDTGEEGEETARPGAVEGEPPLARPPSGSEVHLRPPGDPDETTRPDATNPWEPTYGASIDDTATRPERRLPDQYVLPRGMVASGAAPRAASESKPGNGHPPEPAQQRAGEIRQPRTGSTRPPPPFSRRTTQTGGSEAVTPAPEIAAGTPATVVPAGDAPSAPVQAAGSGAVAAGKRPSPLPALRGVAATPPRRQTPPVGTPTAPPAGQTASASRRVPLPLKPPPPARQSAAARREAAEPPPPAVPVTPPVAAGSIEESIAREAEVRRRIKPNTSDISQIYTELDNVASGRAPTSVGAEAPQEPGPIVGADKVTSPQDRAALRELFNELAGHHLAQLRDLMIEIRGGTALSEWIDLSQPAVASVKGMAEQLELAELCVALDKLLLALAEARIAGGVVHGQPRANVLDAYFPLMELVPGGLELDAERNRREPVIVHSLLRQIPGVEKVTIDKLVAASLISITTLADARPEELAAVTGVSDEIARRLVERFRAYRSEAGVVASPDPGAEHRSLTALLERLREQNAAFDDASKRWSADAREQKRLLRLERAETLLRIHVSLARLGQVERLVELDRLSFKRKADYIDSYLQGVRASRGLPGLNPS
jgi:hypothetical protein